MKEVPELSILLLVGDLPKKPKKTPGPSDEPKKEIDNKIRSELLTYLFSRGFADAVSRCRARGRCVVVLTDAQPNSLVARFAASLAPWRFVNYRMLGVQQGELTSTSAPCPLDYVVMFDEEPVNFEEVERNPALQADMIPSVKVKLAERLRNIFRLNRVAEDNANLFSFKEEEDDEDEMTKGLKRFKKRVEWARRKLLDKLDSLLWILFILTLVVVSVVIPGKKARGGGCEDRIDGVSPLLTPRLASPSLPFFSSQR